MAVHFKFRSAVEYDSINIDGHGISIANLKEKIVDQKNLGRGTDFDLVITNAQSGEEYTEDSLIVPRNTSVIIKRVPATRAKATLLVQDTSAEVLERKVHSGSKDVDVALQAVSTPMDDFYDMDDFGVDLYAIEEPALENARVDEDRKSATMAKTASDWNRCTQETAADDQVLGRETYGRSFARGRGYGRAFPPPGYVCHRCGQPGHFIQHCPTNGDPAYDIKRVKVPICLPRTRLKADQEGSVGGSATFVQPNDRVFAKEADVLLTSPPQLEFPSELRCALCRGILKDAVMIPCCHYSFCDNCVRQALTEKGECPQCRSTKCKIDDLLPNVALRQAISRFTDGELHTTTTDEGARKHQQAPDVESATKVKATSSDTKLCNQSKANEDLLLVVTENGADLTVADSVCESAVDSKERSVLEVNKTMAEAVNVSTGFDSVHKIDENETVEGPSCKVNDDVMDHLDMKDVSGFVRKGKQHVIEAGKTAMVSKISESPYKVVEGVSLESDVSKGKKKKKRIRPVPTDDMIEHIVPGGPRKTDRFCYLCGSPEHLARNCNGNTVDKTVHCLPQRGMFPQVRPGTIPQYGPEMYWHGPPTPHTRPFPMGYSEGMIGSCPVAMPFEGPVIPIAPYGVTHYMTPMYPNPPMHGGFMGGIRPGLMVPMERPLSREEFMELQERERRRRHMQERQQREYSEDKTSSRGRKSPHLGLEHKIHQRRLSVGECQGLSQKCDLDQNSVQNYSNETDHHKSKSKSSSKCLREGLVEYDHHESASDDDTALVNSKIHMSHSEKSQRNMKAMSSETRKDSKYQRAQENRENSDEGGQHDCPLRLSKRASRQQEHVRSGKHSGYDSVIFDKYECSSSRIFEENNHATRQMNKRTISEGSKSVSRNAWHFDQLDDNNSEIKERNISRGDCVYDEEKPNRREHRNHSRCKSDTDTLDYESKKKKRRHRKHDPTSDYLELDHKKHKSSNSSQAFDRNRSISSELVSHMNVGIEESRWPMESGLDE